MTVAATNVSSSDGWLSDDLTDTSSVDGWTSGGSAVVGAGAGAGLQSCLPPTHPEEHLTPMDERNRTLELAKYFEASQIVPASQSAIGDDEVAAAPSAPAADTTLTALAQLGTFKLGCDRAFISLINSTHQYIIGEATQSTSLLDNALRSDDGLCLGVRALELAFGVCPQTIQIFTSDDRTIDTPNVYGDKSRYVIRDFTADAHFTTRPYVKGWPHMRSYAEVPLRSSTGYVIGSYCVVDTRPRDFDDAEIQILDSVGVTIMNHLELLKSQKELCRAQRLVGGIASYAAGYSALQENAHRRSLAPSSQASLPQPTEKNLTLPIRLVRDDSNQTITMPGIGRVFTDETNRSVSDASVETVNSISSWTTLESGCSDASESHADGSGGLDMQRPAPPQSTLEKPLNSSDPAPIPDHSTTRDEAHGGTIFSESASTAVSRASHLIRQSMDLGGVFFVKPGAQNAVALGSSVSVGITNKQDSALENSKCEVIGHSVDVDLLRGNGSDASGLTLSHSLLQRLLERYPFGHVFSFDELGVVLQQHPGEVGQERTHPSRAASQDGSQCSEDSTSPSEAQDAAELLGAATDARSIAFTTLWDYRNDRWFAASISWTVDPLRIFESSELNYLSAFGNSITAEVSRLEVAALSKAKSDFISSISHEMRSPLHGILASTEILRDTMKLEAEVSMLNSIDACGSMLLDTINHLLDYSKITNSPKRKHASRAPKDDESKASELPAVNLSKLVHDVVEGIFIGNVASENASDRDTSDDTSFIRNLRQGQSDLVARKLIEAGDVVTIIDVDASVDWNFRSEAAAWKRIVMNLFGNAMKFTKKGQVSVKLYLARAESDTRETIRLEIHDTGTGIDKDYLQSHLFTAFSQADDISVGTGVGLSIVKRLVEELDGSIDVQSDKGIGTRVNVAIPLGEMTFPVNGLDSLLRKKAPLYANGRHQGHTLYVQGPASSVPKGEQGDPAFPSATAFANADTNMSMFFANLARKGFGMGVVELATPGDDQHQSDGSAHSIYLDSSTSGGAWTLWRHDGGAGDNGADGGSAAAGESKCIVVSIRQPFGPRTLASALDEIMAFTTDTANAPVATKTEENKRKPDTQPPSPSRMSPTEDDKQALLSDSHDGPTAVARETYDTTASPRNQSPPAAENPLSTPKSGPHLLLVDDNAVNLKVLAASVKRGGCTYDQAADGRQAVEAYKSNASAYDLVFMDLSMPVLDGIEATRQIRALEEESGAGLEKRTRIIALTALGDDRHRQRAFEAGVDDFITKPVKMARARELARLAWDG